MANKRPPIQLTELTENLKASTGQGIGAFFPQPPSVPAVEEKTTPGGQQGRVVPPVRAVPVVPGVAVKRIMRRRHPFDIYEDQYEALLDLQRAERRDGGVGSMSAMVREALDAFIEQRRKK